MNQKSFILKNKDNRHPKSFKYNRIRREILNAKMQLCFIECLCYERDVHGGYGITFVIDYRFGWLQKHYVNNGYKWKDKYNWLDDFDITELALNEEEGKPRDRRGDFHSQTS